MAINYHLMRRMLTQGANNIIKNYEYIDKLNVFPIPDGDTGTNLRLSVSGALDFLLPGDSVDALMKQFARGLLMSARGNSGAILSQIFRGFSAACPDLKEITTAEQAIKMFEQGKEIGYKSVLSPVEGTILTVIRMTAESLRKNVAKYKSPEEVFIASVTFAQAALDKTPDLLPILKEAKVVDSGGYGLVKFFEGMKSILSGEAVEDTKQVAKSGTAPVLKSTSDGDYGYCCEFIVKMNEQQQSSYGREKVQKRLLSHGDSLVLVDDEDMVKVHIHSFEPHRVIEVGHKLGEFQKIKIDNMSLQAAHKTMLELKDEIKSSKRKSIREKIRRSKNYKDNGTKTENAIIVAVPNKEIGEYLVNRFKIDNYISQEEIGNPSTQVFIEYLESVNASNIFLVLDNSNISMCANSAAKLYRKSKVTVIPNKNIVHAIHSVSLYGAKESSKINSKVLREHYKEIFYGSVFKAGKDIKIKGLNIGNNTYVTMVGKDYRFVNENQTNALENLVSEIFKSISKPKRILVITGEDAPNSAEDLDFIKKLTQNLIDPKNILIVKGNQKIFTYFIGAE